MLDFDVTEKRFEQDIEESLLTEGGYQKGNPSAFNREIGLDVETFVSFIKTSQPKKWEALSLSQVIQGTVTRKKIH